MMALVSMACSAAAMRYHGQTNTAPARLFWPVAFSNTMVAAGRRAGIAFHRVVALLAAFAVASSEGGDVAMSLFSSPSRVASAQHSRQLGRDPITPTPHSTARSSQLM
jgi:hypothetical protein